MPDATSTSLVIFGGSGDLSLRKLLPSLFKLHRAGLLAGVGGIVAVGRGDGAAFPAVVADHLRRHAPGCWSEDAGRRFIALIRHHRLDATRPEDFAGLGAALGAGGPVVYYLATPSALYGGICRNLAAAGALAGRPVRVVLEKPIGRDLASCREINRQVLAAFAERDVFRIDHYLGKETVQNLLALRFGNSLFGPVWNHQYIDNIQITVAEDIGVGGRDAFYASTGALRDMVQNHLLQLLCLVAMEPPASLQPDTLRDEKVKLLRALTPIAPQTVKQVCVRGQYEAGFAGGAPVPAFLQEEGFAGCADTETFVALRAAIHNWRWVGVPFFLRTGKRLRRRYSEIVVEFKNHPFPLFAGDPNQLTNKLVIRLQPEENITLHTLNKKPGLEPGLRLQPVALNLSAAPDPALQYDAYERLLLDAIAGNPTLFMRGDEIEAAWQWTDGIIRAWEEAGLRPRPYPAGTMGPAAAQALPEREGRGWHE